MTDHRPWIAAVRSSHERLTGLTTRLSPDQAEQRSYDDDWSIAQVTSHLGSQAEIFDLFLQAGLGQGEAPAGDAFQAIWARWDAMPPADQVAESATRNQDLVARLEGLSDDEAERFALSMFGMDLDLAGFAAMRLAEHAVHTWDVAVALDDTAVVSADAVELLVDQLGRVAGRGGKPGAADGSLVIETTTPARRFVLTFGPEVSLREDSGDAQADLRLPAEALVRLVYGRLDPAHMPDDITGSEHLDALRTTFPGF